MSPSRPAPTRRLPTHPHLEQLRKQARELLDRYRAEEPAAISEVQQFERRPDPSTFALNDAQRVLARSYGYESWPRLKAFVDGVNVARFMDAVRSGDVAKVRALLAARPELVHMDTSESNEHRGIHYAVLRRDAAMVRLLMDAGSDARKGIWPHRDATSALELAREREYDEIVTIIEEEEQNRTRELESAPGGAIPPVPAQVTAAIVRGDAARVRELVTADPALLRRIGPSGGLLTLAVKQGQIEIIRTLLDLGADVDERILLEELEEPTPSWGMPLWHAALAGNLEITRLLLDRGADPNANVYASGWPLRNAWNHKDDSTKRLLLERGAKPQPYMIAEAHDTGEAKRLLAANPTEELAHELAWSAADHGCPAIIELALPHLHWSASDPRWHWVLIQPIRGATSTSSENEGYFRCLTILLNHGIDANVPRFGQTALHFLAARHGLAEDDRPRFASLLLDHGARLDLRDDLLRSTPLGWACRWGRVSLVQFLISRGASIDEPDAEPWATPQAWARKMNRGGVLAVL